MNKEELKEKLANTETKIYESMKEFFLPSEVPEKNTLCDESEPEEPAEKQPAKITKSEILAMLIVSIFVLIGIPISMNYEREQYQKLFENNWTVVSESLRECTVTASQLGIDGAYKTSRCIPVVTVQTEDGDTAIFYGEDGREPVAGLSVGDSCTVCIKKYHPHDNDITIKYHGSPLKDGDTAWFINDTIVFRHTKEESENLFMKDF